MKPLDGRPDACETFRENESSLMRFIVARVGCRATAQDIGQEAFLRLNKVRWSTVVNPRAFLFRIAANLVSTYKEQVRRRAELTDRVQDLLWSDFDAATPERHALAEEQLREVWSALQELPERTGQVLTWSRFEGLTNTQIAVRLGISSQAVDRHLRNALDHLMASQRAEKNDRR